MPIECGHQIIGNSIFREVLKGKFMAQAMSLKFSLYALQRMVSQDDIDGTVSAYDEQSCRVSAPGEVRDKVDRRVVTPVQVFENQNQR